MKLINIIKIGVGCIGAMSISAFANEMTTTTITTSPSSQITAGQESTDSLKDAEITTKVKEQFIQQKLFDKAKISPMSIHVKTINGTVILTGKLPSKEQIDTAISITKGINGVKEVKSELETEDKVTD